MATGTVAASPGRSLRRWRTIRGRLISPSSFSCQSLNEGKLNGYRRMIFEDERAAPADQLGFVLHLGDFIYEVVPEFVFPLVRWPMMSVLSAALQTWLTTGRRGLTEEPKVVIRARQRTSIQISASVYTDGEEMAKAAVGARRGPGHRPRSASRRAGWVRKNVVMDQRKLDVARRALGVATETEAIDQALDFIAFRNELAAGFAGVRRSGGVDHVFDRRRKA